VRRIVGEAAAWKDWAKVRGAEIGCAWLSGEGAEESDWADFSSREKRRREAATTESAKSGRRNFLMAS
jgi:hypothetical protein